MLPSILNRDFQHPADGWYMIEPKGEFMNRTARVVQVIDDTALASIAEKFGAEAAKPNFPGMLIDHEHFKHQSDQETRAFGWLMAVQNRADGLYGQVRWTSTGKAAVDGGDYRFFSTEYSRTDTQLLNREGDNAPQRLRPLRLSGLTLTNDPNNKEGFKPITNRAAGAEQHTEEQRKEHMKSVAHALGLAPEASEEAILGAVQILHNRATTAEAKATEHETLTNRLKGELDTLNKARVDDALRTLEDPVLKNRVDADQVESWRHILSSGYDRGIKAFNAFVAECRRGAGSTTANPQPQPGRTPITNRGNAQRPQPQNPGGNNPEIPQDTNAAATLLNRKTREYMGAHRCSYEVADQAVREAHPDLFKAAHPGAFTLAADTGDGN